MHLGTESHKMAGSSYCPANVWDYEMRRLDLALWIWDGTDDIGVQVDVWITLYQGVTSSHGKSQTPL